MLIKLVQLLGFAIGGAGIAIICNIILLRFSQSLGIRNTKDVVIRWSNESKPSLGGVSFFVVFIFAAIGYSIIYSEAPNIFQNRQFVGLFVAGSLAFLMGLADDAYNTQPLIKLAIQITCGLLFISTNSTIDLFHIPIVDSGLTVLWVVIVMNSLNMLDNMDGIAGTTVFFILASCIISCWIVFPFNVNIWILMMVAILGAIVGFLTMNVHPAKIFMGDAGSQFIGLIIAFFSIEFLWNIGSSIPNEVHPSWLGLCVVLVAFTPSGVDTLSVVINRIRKGQSPMVGGRDHTTHHLVYSGRTERKVWVIFVLIGALSTIISVGMIILITLNTYLPIIFCVAYPIYVFVLLYKITIKFPAPRIK